MSCVNNHLDLPYFNFIKSLNKHFNNMADTDGKIDFLELVTNGYDDLDKNQTIFDFKLI